MPHGGGPGFGGGFGGGHGGSFGIGHGGHGGFHGGGFGLHSGSPAGFVGRGAFSPGHHDEPNPTPTEHQPVFISPERPAQPSSASSQYRTQPHQPTAPQPQRQPDPQPVAQPDLPDCLKQPTFRNAAVILAILSLTLSCTMCMSNILAAKLWCLGPIRLDGGFILFPLTYVITDILVELFYRKVANLIIICCCAINTLAFIALNLTAYLPATPGVTNVEPSAVLGLSANIMAASALATLASAFVNNHIYDHMRRYKATRTVSQKAIKRRAWWSSFIAHIPDSLFFTLLAFSSLADIPALCYQMATSYLAGLAIETIFLPVTGYIAFYLHRYIDKPLNVP